jgi:parallel beta-helix repeat protein
MEALMAIRMCAGTCVVLAGLALCGSSTATADDLCGATIVTNLRLDQDLTCAGNGLIVGADGIRLNLNGHTIAGSGSGVGINVAGRSGVSIVGGTVQNFPTGVLVLNSTAVVVKDNQLVHNGDGVDLQAGSIGNTIKGNHFQDNTMRGIMLRSDTSANVIKDNTFAGNRVGILLFGAARSTVKGNTLSFSGLAGIRINVIAANNLIQENTVVSNPAGIEFIVTPTGSSIGNTLRENTLALNTCGLKGPVAGNTLKGNLFEGNAADSCP